ncbi:MAG TPA: hypothetical protein PL124_03065 [Candidatus Cloacimonadota bacterium]|nr:hypothetical protein [Candidatus Cloacimonadota bacterium]HPS38373.1 hypothetical protein [Candidatus Cloacimonadota bacterium]
MLSSINFCPACKRNWEDDEVDYLDVIPEVTYPTDHAHPRECNDPVCPECGAELVEAEYCEYCETWHDTDMHRIGKDHVCKDCLPVILVRNHDRELVETLTKQLAEELNVDDPSDCLISIRKAILKYYREKEDE